MDRVLKQLEAEHIVICQHGKGVFVSPLSEQRRFALIFPSNIYDDQYLSPFWALLHGAAMTQAQAQGDDLRTFYGCPDGDDVSAANAGLVEFLKSKRVDAILTAGVVGANLDWLRQRDKPIASLSNAPTEYGVTVNPKREITLGIESLAAQGCRSIAVVTLDHLVSGAASQMLHLRRTLRESGAEVDAGPGLVPRRFRAWALPGGDRDADHRAEGQGRQGRRKRAAGRTLHPGRHDRPRRADRSAQGGDSAPARHPGHGRLEQRLGVAATVSPRHHADRTRSRPRSSARCSTC